MSNTVNFQSSSVNHRVDDVEHKNEGRSHITVNLPERVPSMLGLNSLTESSNGDSNPGTYSISFYNTSIDSQIENMFLNGSPIGSFTTRKTKNHILNGDSRKIYIYSKWIISFIYDRTKGGNNLRTSIADRNNNSCQIHREDIRAICAGNSKNQKLTMTYLFDNGLVEVSNDYTKGFNATKYKLGSIFNDVEFTKNDNFTPFVVEYRQKSESKKDYEDDNNLFNEADIFLNPSMKDEFMSLIAEDEATRLVYDTINNPERYKFSMDCHRLFTPFTRMKKEYRKYFQIDGENCAIIDIKSANSLFLSKAYDLYKVGFFGKRKNKLDILEKFNITETQRDNERDKYNNLINKGDIYLYIAEWFKNNKPDGYEDAVKSKNGIRSFFKEKWNGYISSGIKKSDSVKKRNAKVSFLLFMEPFLDAEFPVLKACVAEYVKNKKLLVNVLMKDVAECIMELSKKFKGKNIHDAFYCKHNEAQEAAVALQKIITNKLPYIDREVVSVEYLHEENKLQDMNNETISTDDVPFEDDCEHKDTIQDSELEEKVKSIVSSDLVDTLLRRFGNREDKFQELYGEEGDKALDKAFQELVIT